MPIPAYRLTAAGYALLALEDRIPATDAPSAWVLQQLWWSTYEYTTEAWLLAECRRVQQNRASPRGGGHVGGDLVPLADHLGQLHFPGLGHGTLLRQHVTMSRESSP